MASTVELLVRSPRGRQLRCMPFPLHLTGKDIKQLVLKPDVECAQRDDEISSTAADVDAFPLLHVALSGRRLPDCVPLSALRPPWLATLELVPELRGGGGDGGATGAESRDCYLKMYAEKKPDKVDRNDTRMAKWERCALTADALEPPVVADMLGNLFNKEAMVRALVAKSLPRSLAHIKGLKDLVTLQLTENPSAGNGSSRFHCPITGQEFNGHFKFLALKHCGHVLSVRALKEVRSSSCLLCHKLFTENDKIIINGSEEEVDLLRQRMEEQKQAMKEKKEKKRSLTEAATIPSRNSGLQDVQNYVSGGKGVKDIQRKESANARESASIRGYNKHHLNSHQNSGSLGLDESLETYNASRQPAEADGDAERTKRRRPSGSDRVEVEKTFIASQHVPEGATRSVYASIFTSSQKNVKETYMCRSLPIGRN
eukprot:TRINITY_DN2685_c0_g1_i1.p1 TRINITY_DN2685_c0_g1~~TRINITY_DN2685_c0_g1_i1.p1  ORF type:complete len:436 (-),score=67.87 TRINITY_DN2685_c0_g1_i1:130-1416(-)